MTRLRTIKQCVQEFKLNDPNSAISEWLVRSLCKTGKVKSVLSGCKILVNLDDLINYFN